MGIAIPVKRENGITTFEEYLFISDRVFLSMSFRSWITDYKRGELILTHERFILEGVPQFVTTQIRLH